MCLLQHLWGYYQLMHYKNKISHMHKIRFVRDDDGYLKMQLQRKIVISSAVRNLSFLSFWTCFRIYLLLLRCL